MKLDITILVFLGVTTMAVSFCPKCVSTLRDKIFKQTSPSSQPPTPTAVIHVVGRQDITPHIRKARCLELLDWLFEELKPEPDTTTTTTASTTTTVTNTTSPSTQPTPTTPTTAKITGSDDTTAASVATTPATTATTAATTTAGTAATTTAATAATTTAAPTTPKA